MYFYNYLTNTKTNLAHRIWTREGTIPPTERNNGHRT